jgi:predicted ribosomally synthesized peptide with nif11-like leader
MENKLTPELIEKAKTAKSPEELIALAKENGTEMTEERAKKCFEHLHSEGSELTDDELNNVSGGCGDPVIDVDGWCDGFICKTCGSGPIYEHDFRVGTGLGHHDHHDHPVCKCADSEITCADCIYHYCNNTWIWDGDHYCSR